MENTDRYLQQMTKDLERPYETGDRQLRDLLQLVQLLCEALRELRETGQARGAGYFGREQERLPEAVDLIAVIRQRTLRAKAQGLALPFSDLCSRFGLEPFEQFCVLIGAAPDLAPELELTFAQLENSQSPCRASLLLAGELYRLIDRLEEARLYAMLDRQRQVNQLLLTDWRQDSSRAMLLRPLAIPKLLLYALTGVQAGGPEDLGESGRLLPAEEQPVLWNEGRIAAGQRFLARAGEGDPGRPWVLYLHGPAGTGKRFLLSQLSFRTGLRFRRLAAGELLERRPEERSRLLRQFCLCCRLEQSVPCLDIMGVPRDSTPQLEAVLRELRRFFPLLVLCGDRPWYFPRSVELRHLALEHRLPDEGERRALWAHFGARAGLGLTEEELTRIAGLYRLSAADIAALADTLAMGVYGEESLAGQVAHALREQAESCLDKLAYRLPATFHWEDLELPQDSDELLRSACARIRDRYQVHEGWGFGKKLPYGKGVSVLLYGPPGTGKTMTAQVLASQVGLDVFRVDLSQIVDKYIGETEKNLGRLFDTAQDINCILFFDEADALFSKRTEVGDSKDKYANMETAYLLQRIEQFSGVTILATNSARNFDEAFRRRMSYFINVPMPDEATRLRIWQKVFPPELPISRQVKFEELAREFELSGSSIKSVAVSAAYAAAAAGTEVTRSSMYEALRIEYGKTGHLFTEAMYHC